MKVGLIYSTPDYHQLVEMMARECYQSYDKVDDTSKNFIEKITTKDHTSITSTGNIVFGIASIQGLEEYLSLLSDLMTMKEINNYIRWSTPDGKKNPDSKIGIIVSMNIFTFLDINKHIGEYDVSTKVFESFKRLIQRERSLNWFINDKTKLESKENQYITKGEPELYKPVLLTEDYTVLKEKGLTDYELDIHATITLNLKVDRETGLKIWQHTDMMGGTELSQCYIDRSSTEYQCMLGLEKGRYPDLTKYIEKYNVSEDIAKERFNSVVEEFRSALDKQVERYTHLRDDLTMLGFNQSRAKEIARAILPNPLTTKIVNCRPLRQWKHFVKLRDTNHTRKEIQADIQAIKKLFDKVVIPYE
ncbi:FAD-dependent thymidylate synthase [Metabacillus fastidiosus]|uniref:FAD-dependent thymidylate synthase n=1 Tax=Metabacillus fastidiosus TaxID=1458 RepID=UPI003D2D438F